MQAGAHDATLKTETILSLPKWRTNLKLLNFMQRVAGTKFWPLFPPPPPPPPHNEQLSQKHLVPATRPRSVCLPLSLCFNIEKYMILTYWFTIYSSGEERGTGSSGKERFWITYIRFKATIKLNHIYPARIEPRPFSWAILAWTLEVIEHFIEVCCVLKTSHLLDYERKRL